MMTDKQLKMLKALEATFSNITEACKMVGIDRGTHYKWVNKNNDYKNACEDILSSRINIAESQLHKNIAEGKETSLIFFLKCKANYKESQIIEGSQDITLNMV